MRKIIMVLCLAMVVVASPAQNRLSFHAKAGIGTSYLRLDKTRDSDTRLAYKAGLGMEYALSRRWSLQSGLEMVSIGGRETLSGIGEANMSEIYLQVPVLAAACLNLGKEYLVSLSAGAYTACLIRGKIDVRNTIHEKEDARLNFSFREDALGSLENKKISNVRFDAGIALRLTFEYRRFSFGTEVQGGFVTVNKAAWKIMEFFGRKGYAPKNLASFFTLGYRF